MSQELILAKFCGEPEVFHTIQGEGVSIGRPSVFVRLSGCNLHCFWCDTEYTWNFQGTRFAHKFDERAGYRKHVRRDLQIAVNLSDLIRTVCKFPSKNIVITGGEPLLQDAALAAFMGELRKTSPAFEFEIETNGTRLPSAEILRQAPQFNVSPKLSNARMPMDLRIDPGVLSFFAREPRAWFKFVCQEVDDLREVLAIVDQYQLAPERVFLMPEATNTEELVRCREWLVGHCLSNGFRFSDRLHVTVFGNRRGV